MKPPIPPYAYGSRVAHIGVADFLSRADYQSPPSNRTTHPRMSRTLTIADLSDPREAAFVSALLALGGPQHAPTAALRAGYANNDESAQRAAAFLMGSPRIARAITGEIQTRFDGAALAAFSTLLEICVDRRAAANARISAAQEILNRSSLGPIPSRSFAVTAHAGRSVEDFLAELDSLTPEQLDALEREATVIGAAPVTDETE